MDRRILLALIAAALIIGAAGLYIHGTQTSHTPIHRTQTLVIHGSTMNPEDVQTTEGDTLTLRVKADSRFELHIHGYDRKVELEPGKVQTVTFKTDATGHFTMENEDTGTELGSLNVYPPS
jgi:hypothetical protein